MLKNKNIFLTGVTGLVGSYLLKILLDNKNKVYVLARNKNNISAKDRVVNILHFWDRNIMHDNLLDNLDIIDGDIALPDLGIKSKDKIKEIVTQTEIIFHCAALAELNIPLDIIRQINVEGTRYILDLALECKARGKLKKINHISTTYVAGAQNNVEFNEDMLEMGQVFNNTYEQTKYEAELLVKEYLKKGLNISVFRPSMIMGNTEEGKINNFRLFYQPLHFFAQGIYDEFPINLECKQNLINLDTVVKAIFLLGDAEERATYHISSPDDINISWCLHLAADYFGFKVPRFISPREFNFDSWTPAQKALAKSYIPYFDYTIKFISQRTQSLLQQRGFQYPKVDKSNMMKNFAYCHKAGFIKKKG